MRALIYPLGALILALVPTPSSSEPLIWGIEVEQMEYRGLSETEAFAWDLDAFIGSDELKFVWRSEAELDLDETAFETLENQARLQFPISDFFDMVTGVRVDTPEAGTRVHGVLGLHGLAEQWFEVDADLFASQYPSARFEVEYEGLITNWITFTPSIEVEVPFVDDEEMGQGAFGPTLEVGARLGFDLIDRAVSPYIGVHYERLFGATADLARDEGGDDDSLYFVVGTRFLF